MSWASLLQFPDLPDVPEAVRGGSSAVARSRARDDTFDMVPPLAHGDLAMDPPDPLPFLSGHELLGDPPAAAIGDLVAAAGPGSGSPLAMMQLRHMGGALARQAPGAGAHATLPGSVSLFALGLVEDEESAASSTTPPFSKSTARATACAATATNSPNSDQRSLEVGKFSDRI